MSDSALLVLDMQNDLVTGQHAGDMRMENTITAIADLIAWARSREIPIVYSEVCYRPDYVDAHPDSPSRTRYTMVQGTPGSKTIDRLAPGPKDYVIMKRRTGAFHGTDLELVLNGLGARTLLFTGTSTGRAVESTVRAAHDRDFRCIVVSDACYARSEELHQAALLCMGDWFAQIKSAAEVKAELA